MRHVLIWLWCFPQMIAGLIVRIITRARKKDGYYEYDIQSGSVALGEYIFLCPAHWDDRTVLRHEQGHVKQSKILGWLYLIIIGLPSMVWASRYGGLYRYKHKVNYYSFYTERWADELSGIER